MIDAPAAPITDNAPAGHLEPVRLDRPVLLLQRSPWTIVGWIVFTLGLAWFVYAGSVRVCAGHWLGQRLRVQVIWSRFLGFLADHGASAAVVGLVVLITAVTMLGSLVLLWWAIGQRNGDTVLPEAPDEA